MSKCKPSVGPKVASLSKYGVVMEDTIITAGESSTRIVGIRVPYEQLLSNPEVQVAFQDIMTITLKDDGE